MYLHAKKYVEKVNWQALQDNDELSYDSPEVVFPLWNNIVETAGMKDVAVDIYGVHVEVTCAYWRKANQIHKWFVDNVQGGEDNCGEYYVSHEKLKDLLDLVNRALAERNPNLLPPQEGFFFGGTDRDEWYWQDLKNKKTTMSRHYCKKHKKEYQGMCADCIYEFGTTECVGLLLFNLPVRSTLRTTILKSLRSSLPLFIHTLNSACKPTS